jgi:hypothetical protein
MFWTKSDEKRKKKEQHLVKKEMKTGEARGIVGMETKKRFNETARGKQGRQPVKEKERQLGTEEQNKTTKSENGLRRRIERKKRPESRGNATCTRHCWEHNGKEQPVNQA